MTHLLLLRTTQLLLLLLPLPLLPLLLLLLLLLLRSPISLDVHVLHAVVSAVHSDFAEHDRRSRNIIISGLSIASGVNDKQHAENLLKDEFAVSVDVVKCRRLDRQPAGRIQPLLAVLPSASDATYFIENARRLRYSTDPLVFESVYINADLTKAEALAAHQRRCRRREMTAAHRNNRNNTNNAIDGTTGVVTSISISAAPAGNTTRSAVRVSEPQQQQQTSAQKASDHQPAPMPTFNAAVPPFIPQADTS